MAEWWEEEGVFVEDAAPVAPVIPAAGEVNWWEEEGALGAEAPPVEPVTMEESAAAATPFPMEPGESRAAMHLPELLETGVRRFVPEEAGALAGLPQAAAALTMTDPQEIATMMRESFPDSVGIQYAPDGTIIIRNTQTGEAALLNRPGISLMDVAQTLGLAAAFVPGTGLAAKGVGLLGKQAVTQTARRAARKKWKTAAKVGAAAGVTEAGLQVGQELAGGEFNVGDVIFSTVAGVAPDVLAGPAMRAVSAVKGALKPSAETLPKSLVNAIDLADSKGMPIPTSDALWDRLPPFAQTAFQVAKRMPSFLGTGKQQTKKTAARLDLLTELADDFDIDITTELGQDVSDSILKVMVNKRFWGKNKEPSLEQIRKAWKREAVDVEDKVLKKYLDRGEVDSDLVDAIFDSGKPGRIVQLFERLDKNGQLAARRRLITNGLIEAGWDPNQPGAANPAKFYKYLNSQKTRKAIDAFFNEGDKKVLDGAREYLRITGKQAPSDAGPSLAIASVIASIPGVGVVARGIETSPVRQALLKIYHAKDNDKLIEKIMKGMRPTMIALANQAESEDSDIEITDIVPDMIKEKGEGTMEYLRSLEPGVGEVYEDVSGRLQEMLQ